MSQFDSKPISNNTCKSNHKDECDNNNVIINLKQKIKQISLKIYDKCTIYSDQDLNLRRDSINSNQISIKSSSSSRLSQTLSLSNLFKNNTDIESKSELNCLMNFDMTYSRDNLLSVLRDEDNGREIDVLSVLEDDSDEFHERKEIIIPPLPSASYENLNKSKLESLNYLYKFNKFTI